MSQIFKSIKTPKGTRDYVGIDYIQRKRIIETCQKIFEKYNVEGMDTPTFELSEFLNSKGDDASDTAKQTFRLQPDINGAEEYTLIYDNTMPLSRYIQQKQIKKLRRYTIGKVFRQDQPNMKEGRFREFMQCDYDNVSQSKFACKPAEDAETITILLNILMCLNLTKEWRIRINTISILQDLYRWCKIPEELFQTCTRSLDKLDKISSKEVLKELISKGLPEETANKVLITLNRHQNTTIFDILEEKIDFIGTHSQEYLKNFFDYLNTMVPPETISKFIILDFKLARGLDYYTGLIFEVKLTKGNIGSIAAGGRYDNLCICAPETGGIGCVGFSIGVDRILKIMPPIQKKDRTIGFKIFISFLLLNNLHDPLLDVWIIQTESKDEQITFKYRLWILSTLRGANISAGTEMRPTSTLAPQLRYLQSSIPSILLIDFCRYAVKQEIKYAIFVGDEEVEKRTLTLKNLSTKQEVKNLNITQTINQIKL